MVEARGGNTPTDGRTVYDAEHGLADFEHSGEGGVEGVQHLVDALRRVLADVNASAEDFACGVDGNELDFIVLTGEYDAVGNFAEHGLVQEIVIGAIEGEARDAGVDAKFYELETFRLATRGSGGELFCRNGFDHACAQRSRFTF